MVTFLDVANRVFFAQGFSPQEMRNLSESERTALTRMSIDIGMFAVILGLYAMANADDEDKNGLKKPATGGLAWDDKPFLRVWENLALDQIGGSPLGIAEMYGGRHGSAMAPSLVTAYRLMSATWDPHQLYKLRPWRHVTDLVPSFDEDEPTTTPAP